MILGIYDSSSNVSLINSKLLKLKQEKNDCNNADLVTISGVQKASGLTSLKIKIYEIEKVVVFVIKISNMIF